MYSSHLLTHSSHTHTHTHTHTVLDELQLARSKHEHRVNEYHEQADGWYHDGNINVYYIVFLPQSLRIEIISFTYIHTYIHILYYNKV